MNKEIKEVKFEKRFTEYESMYEFLKEMTETDIWEEIPMYGTSLKGAIPGNPLLASDFLHYDEEDVRELEKHGGIYMSTEKGNYVINPYAFFTLKNRLGINCRTAGVLIDNNENVKFANFANIAFSIMPEDSASLALIRGNQILALHSSKYNVHDQDKLIAETQEVLNSRVPTNTFLGGMYSHDRTVARWSLGNKYSEVVRTYVKAWEEAGLDTKDLEDFHPIVEFATSDTGTQTVEFYPQMLQSDRIYSLGTPIKIKHYGGKTMEDVKKAIPMIFAEIEKGSSSLAEMIKIEIKHPIETFVAVAKEVGLTKCAKKILDEILEIEKFSYGVDSTSTAFMIYDSLAGITSTERFANMHPLSQIKIKECITRILKVDWSDLDKPGMRNFD